MKSPSKHFIIGLGLILVLQLSGFNLQAQDLITRKNGDIIKAKVNRIGKKEIEYKMYENPDGPIRVLLVDDVSIITYENGTSDTFAIGRNLETSISAYSQELWEKGREDARKYYKGYKPAMNWSGFGGFFFGGGILPGVILAGIPPRYENLNFPDHNLMRQPDYCDGYKMQASNIKREKVLLATGIASSAYAAIIIAGIIILTTSITHR